MLGDAEPPVCKKCQQVVSWHGEIKPKFCYNCGARLDSENDQAEPGGSWAHLLNPIQKAIKFLQEQAEEVADWTKSQVNYLSESWQERVDRTVNEGMTTAEAQRDATQVQGDPKESFKASLRNAIRLKFAELLKGKPSGETYLTFFDGEYLSSEIRNFYLNKLKFVPRDVDQAIEISMLFLSPNKAQREQVLRTLISASGGATGLGLVIGAVGSALGWGAGLIASIGAAITGASLWGPIGVGTVGAIVAVLAVYFGTTSNNASDSERFMRAFEASNLKAVDAIWDEHGERLSELSPKPNG